MPLEKPLGFFQLTSDAHTYTPVTFGPGYRIMADARFGSVRQPAIVIVFLVAVVL